MASTHSNDPLVGDVLDGRYEVLHRLARGGMATVYRAWDRRLERVVAIKVMHEGLGDDAAFSARFDREARAAARLCDKSLVSIYDQGQDHGRPYIVMEFIQGHTLRAVITKNTPMAPLKVLEMLEPVAAALAVAHESGLVHRDVKPENVLISESGDIKVADFGLARSTQASNATQGMLIGTASYLPPELTTKGRAHSWSDVYSTGVVMFEMLTGTKPYTSDSSISLAYRHVHEDMPAPSTVLARKRPDLANRDPIPDYLDALVVSCTRRNPAARPVDGRELLKRIRRARRALEQGIMNDEALCAVMYPAGVRTAPAVVPDPGTTATAVLATMDEPMRSGHGEIEHTDPDTQPDADISSPDVAGQNGWVAGRPAGAATAAAGAAGGISSLSTPDRRRGPRNAHQPPGRPGRRPVAPPPPPEMAPAREPAPPLTKAQRYRRRRWIAIVLAAVLAVSVVGLGAWWFTEGRYVTTPSVINQTQEQAAAIAAENGFTITFTEEYSETVPTGLVISSIPAPGERVIRETPMSAVISRGPERYEAPSVTGMTIDEAKKTLRAANLALGHVSEDWSDDVEEGMIISASINPGELLKRDTPIDVVVSKGREPIDIPDVVGKTHEEAQHMLEDLGFAVEVAEERHDNEVPQGSVIAQDPIDTKGFRGDTVRLVISSGPELVKVPDVINKRRADGVKILQEAGFDVTVESSRNPFFSLITSTDPQAGTEVPKGTKIKVKIG